jgi:dihydrofolate synthase/folylpolyglutamate synthase
MVQDKDHRGFLKRLMPRARHTVFTQASCERALPAAALKDCMPAGVRSARWSVVPTVPGAVDAALSIAGNDELVCVTGSFYTVGEAMKYLGVGVRESI